MKHWVDEVAEERRGGEITLIFKENRRCAQITSLLEGVVTTSGLSHTSTEAFSLQFPGIGVLPLFLSHCVSRALWKTLLPIFYISIALESVY